MNNSCIEHFILCGPDIRSRDSYIGCYICVQLLQHCPAPDSLRLWLSLKHFCFRGVFVYTGPGSWSVVSLGVGVLGCGDTPVNVS